MKNPFPGMNPWLELSWREAHTSIIIYARDQLQGKLPPGLRARVEEDITLDEEFEQQTARMRPDVHVTEEWDGGAGAATAVAVAEEADPGIIVLEEPFVQRHIEIVNSQ